VVLRTAIRRNGGRNTVSVTGSFTGGGFPPREKWLPLALAVLIVPAVLYAVYWRNPVLAHDLAETFSVVVACGIFMLTWNARNFIDNHYFIFLGIAYLFVGLIDFLHSVSFAGVFTVEHHSDSIELWFAARFLQSFALLAAPLFVSRKVRPLPFLAGFSAIALVLVVSVHYGIFPDYYVPGVGLTHAKSVSDFLVSGVQVLSIGTLWLVRERFDREVFRLLVLSVLFSVAAELSATVYMDAFVYNSVIGHYFKVISFYLVYKAVIATGLVRPYDLLFRNLKKSEEELRAARDGLESRVAERTAELQAANARLEQELTERQRAAEMRELVLDLLQRTGSIGGVREFLSSLASFLKERFGCEAVGIRYRSGADYPYFEARGFSEEFAQAEMSLCSAERGARVEEGGNGEPLCECTCGAVIAGRCDPSLPFFTSRGTFWTNGASELLAANEPIRNIATRGRCIREGYESIALVPLRFGDTTFGLLQLNDRRKEMFQPHILAQIERVAENAGVMLARLLAQEALQESEDRFRSLVENSSVGILIVQEGRIVFWNPRQEQLFRGIRNGLPFREIGAIHPEDVRKFEELCDAMDRTDRIRKDADIRFFLADGESGGKAMRWLHCQASQVNFRGRASHLVDSVDITRVKDLEQIVAVREKLASIGQLAAGIAHEIRNPLSGININVSTLDILCERAEGMDTQEKEKIRAVVSQAKAASEKISSVINRIMRFSKPVPPRMDRIDVNRVVRDALSLSEITNRKRGVEFHEVLSPEPLYCRADLSLLEQVLLNLVMNSLQAMETAGSRKRLTVSTAREGGQAVLRIADTGPGVPEHLRERIFDPFFTTRKEGHGIGLSFCHRIVSEHGGRLSVGAAEEGGAEFRVELPLEEEGSPS